MCDKLTFVYGREKAELILNKLLPKLEAAKQTIQQGKESTWVNEQDVVLITYGDSLQEEGERPLATLHKFLHEQVHETITAVHILPFYPYSSDDGFSVIDYYQVNPVLGTWEDIGQLSRDYKLMFDAVINHISAESEWFKGYLAGEPKYQDYFIEADPTADYSTVTRPRALPLLTKVETAHGEQYVWTTFSADQVDLNYKNEAVLLAIIDVLLFYVQKGAKLLRLDAIGFMWKELGTTCIHLEQTHQLIQLFRDILDEVAPETIIITETNVPHKENISYFGNGYNEAHMVYQFPLPPLVLHAFYTENAEVLSRWMKSLAPTSEQTAFFNFLASHDGIGVRPATGILSESEINMMLDKVKAHGGYVSYKDNGDGTQSPYELNINYLEALSHPDEPVVLKVKRFVAAHGILLSLMGVPAIYIHSLLGSVNDHEGVKRTGQYRSINREKLSYRNVKEALQDPATLRYQVFQALTRLIETRKQHKAFHPNAAQQVLDVDPRIFAVKRTSVDGKETIVALINVSGQEVQLSLASCAHQLDGGVQGYTDLLSDVTLEQVQQGLTLAPYQVMWLQAKRDERES
ncbi:sucrose phosphorylase [Caldalkalibacillus uzonensis]|uniref:Sucrose phosphorylase n=1 Tax=Caldalkalibacillus uzonensis TaxID=353224 RepID=A0ABU0CRI0_9BACI|nr:alpha-amylase family glycosyl hydrolase [Caldalkalibacillus uzonensis]MDQ0338757.1 sucrose phosphorylase [Caldalkalibacillus uzonensis]